MTITYAIPDLHGCRAELQSALTKVDLSNPTTTLLFLGDYIDRGPDSAGVVATVKHLCEAHPGQVVALLGNHEVWWFDWLDGDDGDSTWLLADTGLTTTRSFLPTEVVEAVVADLAGGSIDAVNGALKREVLNRHGDLIEWLRERPLYYETPTHLYVHAGVDEEAGPMWKAMTTAEIFTEKYPPTFGPTSVGKVVVAGHVGVGPLHAKEGRMRCWEPYVDAGHIYLDGRVEETGVLNVMRYDAKTGRTTFL